MMGKSLLYKVKNVGALVLMLAFFVVVGSLVIDEVRRSQDVRVRASGSRIAREAMCEGKEMCDDGKCVGETWRECEPCPVGKARSVYRIACGDDEYSDCILEDDICDDR